MTHEQKPEAVVEECWAVIARGQEAYRKERGMRLNFHEVHLLFGIGPLCQADYSEETWT